MNKKTMMLGGLLAAVAMTANSVSGTYAKYVSKVDLTDEARIARWNLFARETCEITKNGYKQCAIENNKMKLFDDSYSWDGKQYVKSIDGDKVVAPGTTGQYQVNLGGEMETRYKFDIKFSANKDKFVVYYKKLENGKLDISTTEKEGYTAYRPVEYTIDFFGGPESYAHVTSNDLTDLQTKLNNELSGLTFEPTDSVGKSLRITWKWDSEHTVEGSKDYGNELDTYMANNLTMWTSSRFNGNGEETTYADSEGASTTFTLNITATQVTEDYSKPDHNLIIKP